MAKILKMENVENFLMDLDAILDEHGIGKSDITIQLGTESSRVKITGNLAYGQFTNDICRCGCRLRMADGVAWCSSPKCSFIGRR